MPDNTFQTTSTLEGVNTLGAVQTRLLASKNAVDHQAVQHLTMWATNKPEICCGYGRFMLRLRAAVNQSRFGCRRWVSGVALMFLLGAAAGCGGDDSDTAEWLFVQTAETAEMTSSTSLTMPSGENVFAFTDRPNRGHGYLTPAEFAGMWDEGIEGGFAADPPNAVITWVDGDAAAGDATIREAEVLVTGADYESTNDEITYTITVEAGDAPSGDMQRVSLFVDDYPLKCGDNCPSYCYTMIANNFPECAYDIDWQGIPPG